MFGKLLFFKRLCENVCNLIFCREKEHFNNLIMNELSDEVHVSLDVCAMLMLNWVFFELDGTLIVTPKAGWMLVLESKL
jgi:hypothetical protein